jgi:hypothetical protein
VNTLGDAMPEFAVYDDRKRIIPTVQARIYLKDPLVAAQPNGVGIETVQIDGEACLGTGPTSSRVAVVDYNGELDSVFDGAKLNSKGDEFNLGHTTNPVENFYFHQVHVWAVIHKTLELLEASDVLGRQIPWAFPGGRLLVLPHAGYWENAYYDRSTGGLHFFYFEGMATGQPVYTCLSHDIVTHELGHAVLDGLKPYYNEVTSAQTAGFHEYFGDAIALTAALSQRRIAVQVAGVGSGDLSTNNLISNIAAEFGQGLDPDYGALKDAYLRNANNTLTMGELGDEQEEHELSKVPTGAYYDLLREVYERLISAKDRKKANKRVASLMTAAGVTRRMMLRALDYCPPVDLQYEDYAQAVIRADRFAFPIDSSGYRAVAVKIFTKRGLSAALDAPDQELIIRNSQLRSLDIDVLSASTTDAYRFLDRNRAVFDIPAEANFSVINLYRTKKTSANDYRVPQEIVIEFVWQEEIKLTGDEFGPLQGTFFPIWCGGTVVFSREGNLLHFVIKQNTAKRRDALEKYVASQVKHGYLSLDSGERGLGATTGRGAKIVASMVDGRVRLSRNAAMRHFHHDSNKEDHRHG